MDEQRALAERLKTVSHFKSLGLTDLLRIVSSGQVRKFRPGDTIFYEGETCAGMHVLIKGQVELQKAGPQGKISILSTIDPVIMFNEVAVLDGGENPFSAHAIQDCTIWQIHYEAFQSLLARYPQVGLGLLRVLATRNRQMLAQYEDISFRSVLARTAKLLLELSENGTKIIFRREHSLTKMAARISSVPEIISRSLSAFETQDLIEYDRNEILVTDPNELAKLAQISIITHVS